MKHHYISKEKIQGYMDIVIEDTLDTSGPKEAALMRQLWDAFWKELDEAIPVDYVLEDPNPIEIDR